MATPCGAALPVLMPMFQVDGLQPPSGRVYDGEKVPVALLGDGERPHQVHVDVGEALGGQRYGPYSAGGACLVTLVQLHSWQFLSQLMMSHFMHGQVTRLPIILPVTFTPGCARLWKAEKI